jgi:pimeloyl-ACP methyl ester carboxylesterase
LEAEFATREFSNDLDGLHIASWRHDAGASGPELLGLHGWLDNAASLLPLARALPHRSWRAIDLAGHGRSGHKRAGAGEYHVVDWALETALCMRSWGGPPRVLVGHSLGAGVCALVAAFAPELVRGLVFLDGMLPLSAEPDAFVERARRFLHETKEPRANRLFPSFEALVAQRASNGDGLSVESARLLMERACVGMPLPEDVDALSRAEHGSRERTAAIASDPNLKRTTPLRLSHAHLLAVASRIECPVLLVDFGGAHFQRPPEVHAELKAAFASLSIVEEHGGHHLHMDSPERVAPHVERFVAAL